MVKVHIVIREIGRLKPDYSLLFDLPEIPCEGAYISIHRPDKPEPFGEDLIVRKVWWRLEHPETRPVIPGEEPLKIGRVEEIFVECDPALGPYSSDAWRKTVGHGIEKGTVEEFKVSRFAVQEVGAKP